MPVDQKRSIVTLQSDLPYEPWTEAIADLAPCGPAHAASRISSNPNGRTNKFGWLQSGTFPSRLMTWNDLHGVSGNNPVDQQTTMDRSRKGLSLRRLIS
jgi:hypothetical protein